MTKKNPPWMALEVAHLQYGAKKKQRLGDLSQYQGLISGALRGVRSTPRNSGK